MQIKSASGSSSTFIVSSERCLSESHTSGRIAQSQTADQRSTPSMQLPGLLLHLPRPRSSETLDSPEDHWNLLDKAKVHVASIMDIYCCVDYPSLMNVYPGEKSKPTPPRSEATRKAGKSNIPPERANRKGSKEE